jgi:tripartite ATP-independent transporter DctP family solute receptor
MNRNVWKLAVTMAAFMLLSTVGSEKAFAQEQLRWAHVFNESQPLHTESVWAAEEIKRLTNGKFEITVFPASSLGKETDLNQGLAIGTIDMVIGGSSFAISQYPRMGIAYYPYIFRDAEHLLKYAESDLFAEMTEEFRAATGIQIVAYTYYGTRHTTARRSFATCEEMNGLKIRVPGVPIYAAYPRACGANPTPIAFAETYIALQNGTVDGQENPLPTIDAMKFYEVQEAIMLTGHIVDGLVTMISPTLWDRLTEDERQIFINVTREAAARATAKIIEAELDLVDRFRSAGVEVVEVEQGGFKAAVEQNIPLEEFGFLSDDYKAIQAIE